METAIITLSPEEKIQSHFLIFESQAAEWMIKAKTIKVTDASQKDLMKGAKDARLALRTIRTDCDKKHKELKEESLREGQMLDKVRRKLVALIEPIEQYLYEQETFVEVQQEKIRKELFDKRLIELKLYISEQEARSFPLGDMKDEAFANLLSGYKLAKEAKDKKDADDKAEVERLRSERAERLKVRVDRLVKMGFTDGMYEMKHADFAVRKNDVDTMLDATFEKFVVEAIARNDADKKREETNAKRRASRAPDKDKLLAYAHELGQVKVPNVSDDEAHKILANAIDLIAKVQNYLTTNANKL